MSGVLSVFCQPSRLVCSWREVLWKLPPLSLGGGVGEVCLSQEADSTPAHTCSGWRIPEPPQYFWDLVCGSEAQCGSECGPDPRLWGSIPKGQQSLLDGVALRLLGVPVLGSKGRGPCPRGSSEPAACPALLFCTVLSRGQGVLWKPSLSFSPSG